ASEPGARRLRTPPRGASRPDDLRVQAAPEALQQTPQLRPNGERDHEVAGGVRHVEPHAGSVPRDKRLPRVRIEGPPLPDVHERAERETEDAANDGERNPAAEERRRERADGAAPAPEEHLPESPRALGQEEVRDKRSHRAN